MNIYIGIDRIIGLDGKAVSYHPTVHWDLDDADSASQKTMDIIKEHLENHLLDCFRAIDIERREEGAVPEELCK